MQIVHDTPVKSATHVLCTRRIQFCCGHRVHRHESKCAHLHGHNYVVLFHARGPKLDAIGRVIDFSELKTRLGGWIDEHWDPGFVLWRGDQRAIDAVSSMEGQRLYLLDENPTAENMAAHLLHRIAPAALAGTDVTVVRVTLWETENCFADAALEVIPVTDASGVLR